VNGYRGIAYKTVVINLTTGRAFRGAILKTFRDTLVVGNAELIEPGADPVPVPGTVVIERARVEFVQVV